MVRNDFTFIRRIEKISQNPKCKLRKRWFLLGWIKFLQEEAKLNFLNTTVNHFE